jgi:hypothetical protein
VVLCAAQEVLRAEAEVLREDTQRLARGSNASEARAQIALLREHMERLIEFNARLEMLHAAGGTLLDARPQKHYSLTRST